MVRIPCAIIGSGNIGTDLMIKIIRTSKILEMGAFVGIDPQSDGLARAAASACRRPTTASTGLLRHAELQGHRDRLRCHLRQGSPAQQRALAARTARTLIDLTPAAIGPYTIPAVNGDANLDEPNVNMVTCGGQATIPIVYAVRRAVTRVIYGEIVASIASKSAGPGTRANIDEFTETTSRAIERARRRGTRQGDHHPQPCRAAADHARHRLRLSRAARSEAIEASVQAMVADVQKYVPGYRAQAKGAVRTHRRQRAGAHSRSWPQFRA